jgi:hypothetical protein
MKNRKDIPEWTKPENIRWAAWGWDHLTYYRRMGARDVSFWGNSGWLEKWWLRLHDEKTLDQLADMGVNVLITHFFKGMGMETEKAMLDDLRRLIELCRPRGIRTVGYTFGTIFSETFVKEVPEATDWAIRLPDGSLRNWSGSYYRWSPCLNSGYYEYLLKLVDFGAKDIGLDGFHFDNSYSSACYCERCRKKFREYLELRFTTPERFGFTGFSQVSPPPPEANVRDPLKQEWIRFRTLALAEKMEGIYRHIKEINPNLAVLSNPAFPRRANWADQLAVNPLLFGRCHDLMFAENGNFPSASDGKAVSQAQAYAFGDSVGYGVVASCWPRSPETGEHALPERESQSVISILEPAIFGHAPGTTWACRSIKGDSIALDLQPLMDGAKKAFAFLNSRRDLFAGAKTPAETGLLHSFESFAFAHERVAPAYDGFERFLSLKGVPYRLAFTEEPERFADFKTLIVSSQLCLSDTIIRELLGFVGNGGKLVLTGRSGERTENLLAREENPFIAILNSQNVLYLPETPETIPLEKDPSGKWMERNTWVLPPRHAELSAALEKAFGKEFFPIRLDATATVLPVIKTLAGGRHVIHLLNYDDKSPVACVTLKLGTMFGKIKTVRIHRLEGVPEKKPIGSDRTIEIQNLNLYAGVEL